MSDLSPYISVREAAQYLGVSEKRILELIDAKELRAYRIANQFLRLKKEEVVSLKKSGQVATETEAIPYTWTERISDFFYFNDFYILSALIIFILLALIFGWQV